MESKLSIRKEVRMKIDWKIWGKQRGIKQEDLANALEVSRQTIGSLENGRYNPSIQLAFKIARYFDMSIEEIFIYEEESKWKKKKPFVIEILVGIGLVCVSFFVKADYYSTMIFSMGVGIMAASIVQIIRITYWQNPKRYAGIWSKKEEAHINSVDEENNIYEWKPVMSPIKSWHFLYLILSLILALVRVEVWIIAMIFLLFVLQWLIGVIVFHMLEKRM